MMAPTSYASTHRALMVWTLSQSHVSGMVVYVLCHVPLYSYGSLKLVEDQTARL